MRMSPINSRGRSGSVGWPPAWVGTTTASAALGEDLAAGWRAAGGADVD
jgi:hypothetical protein